MRVAAAQFAPESLAPDVNLARMASQVADATARGASLIVFPELADAGYVRWPAARTDMTLVGRYASHAARIPGPRSETLGAVARRHGVYVAAGLLEADAHVAGQLYNALVVLDPRGALVGHYRKIHLSLVEKVYFTPGQRLVVAATELGRLGLGICYDALFPEFCRALAVGGADVLCLGWNAAYPRAAEDGTTAGYPRSALANTVRQRAFENCTGVVSASRVGEDAFSGGRFFGFSQVVSPWGEVLAGSETDAEELVVADLDVSGLVALRGTRPLLQDRRPDVYAQWLTV